MNEKHTLIWLGIKDIAVTQGRGSVRLTVSDDAVITLNGRVVGLADLKVDDVIELTMKRGVGVTALTATRGSSKGSSTSRVAVFKERLL